MRSDRLAIRGIGIVGGFGCGTSAAREAVAANRSPNSRIMVSMPNGNYACPVYEADSTPLRSFIKPAKLRRIDKFSQLALLGAVQAIDDAGISISGDNSRIGVVVGTGYGTSTTTFGFLDSVILEGDCFASPTLFSNSIHSSAGANITILLQITGPCLTVSQFEMSTVAALLNARLWLMQETVDVVLFVAVDEINSVLAYCYLNYFGPNMPAGIEPLNYDKQTAIPGEGAVCLVLTRDTRDAAKYGYISDVHWQYTDSVILRQMDGSIMGGDGHCRSGRRYKQLKLRPENTVTAYTDVYGSMPCGQAFDVALACIDPEKWRPGSSVCSIKLDCAGNAGLIHVSQC